MTSKALARHALKFASLATLMLQAIPSGAAPASPKEAGIWYDDSGKGAVKIELCGDKLCGSIYWLKDQLNAEGKPLRDKHNPNESQQNRPICGLQVVGGLAHMETGEWDTGWIYDPKEGKSYSVAMSLADPNTLKVTGYLVMKMMGRTLTWTRAPADLPACSTTAASAPKAEPAAVKASMTKTAPPPSKVAAPVPRDDQAEAVAQAAPAPEEQAPAPAAPPAVKKKPAAKAAVPPPAAAETAGAGTEAGDMAPADMAPADPATAPPAKPAAAKPAIKKAAATGASSADPATAPKAAAKTNATKTDAKPAAAKTASKTKPSEQLPWKANQAAANKEAPAAGGAPTAETSTTAEVPVAVKPPRPVTADDQARPFQ